MLIYRYKILTEHKNIKREMLKMKYNFAEIGERIKKERKAHGFKSQDSLVDELKERFAFPITRQTLAKIEKGENNHYDCDLLFALCEIFDCEMGYLLCEYDTRYGREKDVATDTGLSQEAATELCQLVWYKDILSRLIVDKRFLQLLITIDKAKSNQILDDTYAQEKVVHLKSILKGDGYGVTMFNSPDDVSQYFVRAAQDILAAIINDMPFRPRFSDNDVKPDFLGMLREIESKTRRSATTGGINGGIESKKR